MPPTLHARLGASSAERWLACPGSIRMSAGIEDTGSPYAWEGTAAHALAEECLRTGVSPYISVGEYISVQIAEGLCETIEVTDEMAAAVDEFVEYVRGRVAAAGPNAKVYYERTASLERLNPPKGVPMFGTADVVIWDPDTKHLIVIDYKHGQGVVVEVFENKQTMYYALVATVAEGVMPNTIEVTIVQPRAYHDDGSTRTYEFDRARLIEWKKELFEGAARTLEPGAPLVVGDHCKFCPARATCPARREHAVEVAMTEFDIEDAPGLPVVTALTADQVARVVLAAPLVMDWLRDVEAHALKQAEAGVTLPGLKLVEKRTNRRWLDEAAAEGFLAKKGLTKGDRTKTKVISPSQAEKVLKAKGLPNAGLEDHWEKPKGQNKLAPEEDPRPAALPQVEQEFDLLDALESSVQSTMKSEKSA